MLEARLREAVLLKKVLDAVRELITDANFECSEDGIRLQAMDNSHVALSAIELRTDCFEEFRCDRPMSIGVSLSSLGKILKGANNDDVLSLKKSDDGDTLQMTFESPKSDRVGEFEMKLMDIDSEHLGIPDTQYDAVVKMSSGEFGRICRDLANIGESVKIEVSKEGVSFSAEGEIGAARMTLKQGSGTAMQQAVNLTFSLKYLSNFAKAAPLADEVQLHMSNEVPLLCEFGFENGYVRFYLAPKLSEDDD
ncbi:hypothetical protein [Sporisorium scitamineum]|uniref:DNA sliding clamp PCNA n=1 Tax=Sporisorium scitamineum TaxID=49012 RepID=A0A0F7S0U2_9BASI|nr:hypothetical protein [Sporisorium scitamineum]